MELVNQFIYALRSPATHGSVVVSEALDLTYTYDGEVARSLSRSVLVEFANAVPLGVYPVVYRLGFEDEMEVAPSQTTSTHLPGHTQLQIGPCD